MATRFIRPRSVSPVRTVSVPTPAAERAGSVRSGSASAPSVFWSLLLNGRHEAPPCRCARRSGLVSDGAAQYEGKELDLRCELGCHCVSRNLLGLATKSNARNGQKSQIRMHLSPNGTEQTLLKLFMLARKREASCLLRRDPVRRRMQHSASPATTHASRENSAPRIWVLSELGQPRRGDDPPLKGG
jgi:hypothetical protein